MFNTDRAVYESERYQYELTLVHCRILLIYNGMKDKAYFLDIVLYVQNLQFTILLFQICADT